MWTKKEKCSKCKLNNLSLALCVCVCACLFWGAGEISSVLIFFWNKRSEFEWKGKRIIKTVYKVQIRVEIGENKYANEKTEISPRKIVAHKVLFFLNL